MATLKPLYGSSVSFTVTSLASLATDTNLLAGWQSAVVDNTTNLYIDETVSAQIKVGSSAPTVNTTVEIWIYSVLDDTPTYPDTITGSQGTVTLTSTNTKNAGLRLGTTITIDATANRIYSVAPFSVAALFGGNMPQKWGAYISQNTGVALGTTQVVTHKPMQLQSV